MPVSTSVILIALQGLILLSLWTLLYQVVRQQGRLLLRLDALDRRLSDFDSDGAEDDDRGGLDVGTPVSSPPLHALDGRMVSLKDYLGRHLLLVHWSPECVFCELIAPELARLEPDLRARGAQLVLVSTKDAEANRKLAQEHGLTCPIALVPEDGPLVQGAFRDQGTPVAYLLDERGRVARPIAVGGDEILAMAREVVGAKAVRVRLPGERPLSQSRIERNGLKAGTVAPLFRLPGVRGGTVALEDHRGKKVLLVFSDPHCGPCEELAPHLVRIHRRYRDEGLVVLVVSRGDIRENRRKADRDGFEFPVALQERWDLSKKYGIFAMPVAFLIDEGGVIMRDVAKGVAEIMALVHGEMEAVRA